MMNLLIIVFDLIYLIMVIMTYRTIKAGEITLMLELSLSFPPLLVCCQIRRQANYYFHFTYYLSYIS